VVGNRDVFVIDVERIVRVAPHTAISRVVDAGKEIGEAADRRRQVQGAVACVVQQPRGERLDFGPVGAVCRQQRGEAPAQRETRFLPRGHQRIQGCSGPRFGRARRLPGKQSRF
jgi:hypothetical protein